jgi:hypothetical protein
MVVVAIALGLWGLNAWLDRQDWFPESRAAKLMSTARLRCDPIWTTVASGRAPAWTDPAGNLYLVSGPSSEQDNAALNRCARANLGPGVPPVHWPKFVTIAALLLALSSIPLIAKPRRASRVPEPERPDEATRNRRRERPSPAIASMPPVRPVEHEFGTRATSDRYCIRCGTPITPGIWYCPSCGRPRHQTTPQRPHQTLPQPTTLTPSLDTEEDEERTLWRRFRRQPAWVQVVAWLLGGSLMVIFFLWSGTDLPWYGKLGAVCGILAPIVAFSYALG